MVNKKIIKYVDDVMSQIDAEDIDKVKMENDLIRRIFRSDECNDVNAIIEKFGTPKELAIEMITHFDDDYELSDRQNTRYGSRREHERHMSQKPYGEYMSEENNTNIKLLYIPLIQIFSGTQRIRLPIVDSYYEDEY